MGEDVGCQFKPHVIILESEEIQVTVEQNLEQNLHVFNDNFRE